MTQMIERFRDELVFGEPEQVAAALATARRRGELVGHAPAVMLASGEVRVAARFVERVAAAPSSTRRAPLAGAAALAAVVALALVGVVAVVWVVLANLLVILGVAALALLGWWLLGQGGACPGLHCPGCRCGG